MDKKTFLLSCSPSQAKQIAEALKHYAAAAYPAGGSECTQVSRSALLDSVDLILSIDSTNKQVLLRKRQRSIYAAAINWYFSNEGARDNNLRADLNVFFERQKK